MCGIVGFIGQENIAEDIFEGLLRLEYRGYDSAGIAVLEGGRIKAKKTAGRVSELEEPTKELSGRVGIGHTRWATHGAATVENAHPHISYDGRFALVHNGIIENYADLRAELEKKGIPFKSDTDSEVIVQLIAQNYFGDPIRALNAALKKLEGSFALALICTDIPGSILAAKKGSPLIAGYGGGKSILASDMLALSPHPEKIYIPEDGELLEMTKNELKFYRDGDPVKKEPEEVKMENTVADKGEFSHFMLKELYDQPEVIKNMTEKRIRNGRVFLEELYDVTLPSDIKQINIVACGSAYHAGMAGRYILEELLKMPVFVDIASEFRYRLPLRLEESLTVFISQSGETADTIAAAEEVKRLGGRTVSIVNVKGSHLSRVSDYTLYTEAGPEISVATTKGYTSQIVMLCLFGIWMAERLETAEKPLLSAAVDAVKSLPEIILRCLGAKDKIKELSEKIAGEESVYFIGRNLDFAVALEASLKLKEVSYIHSEAYAAGELKHGSISLIEEGSIVFALNCYSPLTEKTVSNIREVKARGGRVFAVCCENDNLTPAVADEVITLPIIHPIVGAVCEAIPFQLLAYFTAEKRGTDIDKPRNLAKSVTVE